MTSKTILAIGAHPDDIEFGCGAILIKARDEGSSVHVMILSQGESGTAGDPYTRLKEAQKAADILGNDLLFLPLDGDARLQSSFENTLKIARIIRELKPDLVLAPTGHRNQHPDHVEASYLAQKAVRLARYGGLRELKDMEPHRSCKTAFFDITTGKSENYGTPVIMDVSGCKDPWVELMNCHQSQMGLKPYVDMQIARATAMGIENNVQLAQCMYLEQVPVFGSLGALIDSKASRF